MTWRPIETAPRDGTEILIAYDVQAGRRVTTGRWCTDPDDLGWHVDVGRVPATHWMPMPEAPRE